MKHQVIYLLSVINLFDLSEECNSSVYLLINANVDIVDNYFPGGDTYVSLSPNYLFREDIKNNPAVWIGILFETFIILIFPIIYLKSQNSNICIFMQNCNISLFAPDLTEVKSLQYLFNISTKCFSSNTRQQSALFFLLLSCIKRCVSWFDFIDKNLKIKYTHIRQSVSVGSCRNVNFTIIYIY